MRTINEIIIHCTATIEGKHVTVADIDRWHKAKGWKECGYHFVVYLDGSIHDGRPIEQAGAHSIGVAYVGGLDIYSRPKDTRTGPQKRALKELVAKLQKTFPQATLHCHNEFANKACPCFNKDAL